MSNVTLTKPNPLKQAYSTLDSIIEEVVLDEEIALKIMCSKLQEENQKLNSPVISGIIDLLKDWGKIPASHIKEWALKL